MVIISRDWLVNKNLGHKAADVVEECWRGEAKIVRKVDWRERRGQLGWLCEDERWELVLRSAPGAKQKRKVSKEVLFELR